MCKNCLSYQLTAHTNLSTSASPVPSPDVQTPVFVVERADQPPSEPATQNERVARADYVEIVDAPADVSTPYGLFAGDTITASTDHIDRDWFRVTVNPGAMIEINVASTPDIWMSALLYDAEGKFIKNIDYYNQDTTRNIHKNETDDSVVFYLQTSVLHVRSSADFPTEYTVNVEEILPDRYRFEEGVDAPDDKTTPYELVAGETFSGSFPFYYDKDWIRITAAAGQTLEIKVAAELSTDNEAINADLRYETGFYVGTRENYSESGVSFIYENTSTEEIDLYLELQGRGVNYGMDYTVTVQGDSPPPPLSEYTHDQIATYLSSGYWGGTFAFDVVPGGFLTADITGLTTAGQYLATTALEAWTAVTGINFRFVSSGAQITFDDDDTGAYAEFFNTGSTITSADINISTGWLGTYGTSLDSYSFQTYLHEIGHALGLGHAGNYDVTATYGVDNLYLNDSWQASVMSYFDQEENTYVDASFAYLLTPMVADILAVQELYGTPTNIRTGNTTYGFNSTAGGYLDSFIRQNGAVAGTIVDSSGIDTLDFSGFSADQVIDLREEQASNIGGFVGNFFIARGTVLENAIGGGGDDVLVGNSSNNYLIGGAGTDRIFAGAGDDTVHFARGDIFWNNGIAIDIGGEGNDTLIIENGSRFRTSGLSWYGFERFFGADGDDRVKGNNANVDYFLNGGEGDDELIGNAGDDTLIGGAGTDRIFAGAGDDTVHFTRGDIFWNNGIAIDIGGEGNDTLIIENGSRFRTSGLSWYGFERFFGADGDDRVKGNNANVDYFLNGGEGDDELIGNAGDDTLIGGAGADRIFAGAGDDTVHFARGDIFWNNGIAIDIGGEGNDTLIIENGSRFRTSGLSWYGFERFFGADGDDRVKGNNANVDYFLNGGEGDDELIGNAGDDTLIGGAGADRIFAGAGDDTVHFARGDIFWNNGIAIDIGGEGNDTLIIENGSRFRTSGLSWYGFERFFGADGDDRVKGNNANVDYFLNGGEGDDELIGNAGDDTLIGGAGTDRIFAGAGDDTVHFARGDIFWNNGIAIDIGGEGNDTLIIENGSRFRTSGLSWYGFERFFGADDDDRVKGNNANVDYFLNGGEGDDELIGNAGDDTLIGGAGTDTLSGGLGIDKFYFNKFSGNDKITDFSLANDKIVFNDSDIYYDLIKITELNGNAYLTYLDNSVHLLDVSSELITKDTFVFT